MPQGDKSKYTDKQERKADHIAEGYEKRGVSDKRQSDERGPLSTRMMAAARKKAATKAETPPLPDPGKKSRPLQKKLQLPVSGTLITMLIIKRLAEVATFVATSSHLPRVLQSPGVFFGRFSELSSVHGVSRAQLEGGNHDHTWQTCRSKRAGDLL